MNINIKDTDKTTDVNQVTELLDKELTELSEESNLDKKDISDFVGKTFKSSDGYSIEVIREYLKK